MSIIKANGAGDQSLGFYNGIATQSLRLDSGSSAYLTRTPSSASNRKTFVFSAWIKRCALGGNKSFFGSYFANDNNSQFYISFNSSNKLVVSLFSTYTITSDAVFRDVSSWYHVVVACDVTQSTDSNRWEVYVNGQEITFTGTYPPNANTAINSTNAVYVGYNNVSGFYFDGYLAEVNFIDGLSFFSDTSGTANTSFNINSFGETKNGVWIAKKYTGSYGTNGFRLAFNSSDFNESGSAITDPYGSGTDVPDDDVADASGSGNHFSVGGLVTSDFGMLDSPENNFCTMNSTDLQYNAELLNGNLHIKATTYSGGNYGHSICTFKIPESGKWYIEVLSKNLLGTGNATSFGVMDRNVVQLPSNKASPNYVVTTDEGFDGLQHQHAIGSEYVAIKVDGVNSGSNISMTTSGNIGSVSALAIDVDNGYLYVGATDGTGGTGSQIRWLDYADGSTGTSNVDPESGSSGTGGIARTFTNNDVISVETTVNGSNNAKTQVYLNAGQDSSFAGTLTAQGNSDANGVGDFYYQVPSGYLALCTSNLEEPTISPNQSEQAVNHMGILTYTGTDADGRTITSGDTDNGIGGEIDFTPDWVWVKARNSSSNYHLLFDSVRGATKYLFSNETDDESTQADSLSEFNTNGFTVSDNTSGADMNSSSHTYVAWNWKAGGTASTIAVDSVSTGVPSIASSVSANTTAGFSIVTYTGTGSAGTIGHGLGKKPNHIIFKSRTENGTSWANYVSDLGAGKYLALQSDQAQNAGTDTTRFNNTEPTTSVFSVGTHVSVNTSSSHTYVAYCFAEVDGFSRFGSYTGNGLADGTFVYTGFRPTFIMSKKSSGSGNWEMFDTTRDPINYSGKYILANSADAEGDTGTNTAGHIFDILSNGFKLRNTNSDRNSAGGTYIYMAFAETPFKYANAR